MNLLNPQKESLVLAPQLSYHQIEPLQLKSLAIRGHSDTEKKTCKVEMRVYNPNKHFYLPGSITPADEKRISGRTMEGVCSREWDCGEKAQFPMGIDRLFAMCSYAFDSQIFYNKEDKLMRQGLTLNTKSTTFIGRNQMTLESSVILDAQNIPKDKFCNSQECSWSNITLPIKAIDYKWQTGWFGCHPDYCDGMGSLAPIPLD